jgi:hypothetical protein
MLHYYIHYPEAEMRSLALMLLTILALGLSGPAAAHTPQPPPPEPAHLEAARSFVRTLPIAEEMTMSFPIQTGVRAELEQALAEQAATMDGAIRKDGTGALVRRGIGTRIDRHLPAILPGAAEEMAIVYARQFSISELEAAARFFASPEGRKMARRFVSTDPVVSSSLRPPLYRVLDPELKAIVAEAKSGERLRRRINAR